MAMSQILQHSPGQQVTLVFEILDANGVRSDGYMGSLPQVSRIVFPTLTLAADYPKDMTKIDDGLFFFKFTLPAGSSAVGTYIADIAWFDPDTSDLKQTFFQIVVTAPFGNYTISSV